VKRTSDIVAVIDEAIRICLVGFVFLLPLIWSSGVAASFFIPKFVLLIVVSLFLVACGLMRCIWRGSVKITPLVVLVLVYLLWAFISALFSAGPTSSLLGRYNFGQGFISHLGWGIIFLTTASLSWEEDDLRKVALALLISAGLISIISLLQLLGQDALLLRIGLRGMAHYGRASGTLGNPVYLGGFLVLVLPVVFCLYLDTHEVRGSLILGLAGCGLFFVGLASFSRAAWLGMLGSAIFLLVLMGWKYLNAQRVPYRTLSTGRIKVILFAAAIGVILVASLFAFGTERAGTLSERVMSTTEVGTGTAVTRLLNWQTGLKMTSARPLFGWGPAQYRIGFNQHAVPKLVFIEGLASDDAHNLVVNTVATLGIPGLIFFLAIAVWVIIKGWRESRLRLTAGSPLLAGYLAAVVGYLIWAQFNPITVSIAPLFWVAIAIVVARAAGGAPAAGLQPGRALPSFVKLIFSAVIVFCLLLLLAFPWRLWAADAHFLRAELYGSERDYLRSIQLNPYYETYYWGLSNFYLESLAQNKSESFVEKAIEVNEKALNLAPADPEGYIHLADAYVIGGDVFDKKGRYERAITHLQRALELRPLSGIVHYDLGYCHLKLGEYERAIFYLKKANQVTKPIADTYYLLGQSYEGLNQTEAARDAYQKALELKPDMEAAREAISEL